MRRNGHALESGTRRVENLAGGEFAARRGVLTRADGEQMPMRAMVDVGAVLGGRGGRRLMVSAGRREAPVRQRGGDGIVVVRVRKQGLDRRQHREQRNERGSSTEDAKQERSTTHHRETTRPLEIKNSCGYRTCEVDPAAPSRVSERCGADDGGYPRRGPRARVHGCAGRVDWSFPHPGNTIGDAERAAPPSALVSGRHEHSKTPPRMRQQLEAPRPLELRWATPRRYSDLRSSARYLLRTAPCRVHGLSARRELQGSVDA